MIKLIKKLFSESGVTDVNDKQFENEQQNDENRKLNLATCILFVAIGSVDSDFDEDEKNFVISVMKETYNLDEKYVEELIELSEKEVSESDSIYEYTTTIDSSFSNEQKFELLKNLWRLIFVDKKLDKYEERLVKKIGTLLNVEYRDIIAAKLIIKEEKEK